MKPMLLSIACGLLTAALVPAQQIPARLHRQQARIAQGVRSGALTPGETARLEREQARIRAEIRKDRVDGGAFTPRERARADRMLDQASRDIYRLKHNGRIR